MFIQPIKLASVFLPPLTAQKLLLLFYLSVDSFILFKIKFLFCYFLELFIKDMFGFLYQEKSTWICHESSQDLSHWYFLSNPTSICTLADMNLPSLQEKLLMFEQHCQVYDCKLAYIRSWDTELNKMTFPWVVYWQNNAVLQVFLVYSTLYYVFWRKFDLSIIINTGWIKFSNCFFDHKMITALPSIEGLDFSIIFIDRSKLLFISVRSSISSLIFPIKILLT